MKVVLIIVLLYVCAAKADTYSNRYDSMDVDEVLSNKRLLGAYINCMLEKGKCTSEGRELKAHITDALQSGCTKCTHTQRQGIRRVIKHLISFENGSWNQLVDLYDPQREYSQRYEKELRSL